MGEIIGSILVLLAVVALVGLVIFGMIREKKRGKGSSCGCGCSGCPMRGKCHPAQGEDKATEN